MKKNLSKALALTLAFTCAASLAACGTASTGTTAAASKAAATTAGTTKAAAAATTKAAVTTAAATTKAAATTAAATTKASGAKEQLVVADWGAPTSTNLKSVVGDFEKKFNCTIVIDETGGNADRLNKIRAQKNDPQTDVVFITDSFAVIGNQEGLFTKLDSSVVTNLKDLYSFADFDKGTGTAYSMSRYGIVYNKDSEPTPPASYMDLFDDKYAGKVCLPAMTSTAGPSLLLAIAEDLSGHTYGKDLSDADIKAAFDFYQKKKNNIALWYNSGADVINAFSTGEISVAVFMDMFVPTLQKAGVNVAWADAKEGNFSGLATLNVVKGSKHEKLANEFVNYMLSADIQSKYAALAFEAPVNKNATLPDNLKGFLAFGSDAMKNLKIYDLAYINGKKAEWAESFSKVISQ
jgi:putative spermidine/putrescine transport system substrate-binding protein